MLQNSVRIKFGHKAQIIADSFITHVLGNDITIQLKYAIIMH